MGTKGITGVAAAALALFPGPAAAEVPLGRFEASGGPAIAVFEHTRSCGPEGERAAELVSQGIRTVRVGPTWIDAGSGHHPIVLRQETMIGSRYVPPGRPRGAGWATTIAVDGRGFALMLVRTQLRGGLVCADTAVRQLKLME